MPSPIVIYAQLMQVAILNASLALQDSSFLAINPFACPAISKIAINVQTMEMMLQFAKAAQQIIYTTIFAPIAETSVPIALKKPLETCPYAHHAVTVIFWQMIKVHAMEHAIMLLPIAISATRILQIT